MNPITVRDLRRFNRVIPLHFCGAVYIVVLLAAIATYPFTAYKDSVADLISPMLVTLLIFAGYLGIPVAIFWPIANLAKSTLQDELFDLVPLNAENRARGFFLTALILSLFVALLLIPLPFMALIDENKQWGFANKAGIVLFPVGVILFSCSCCLYLASYFIRIRSWNEMILSMGACCFGYILLGTPLTVFMEGVSPRFLHDSQGDPVYVIVTFIACLCLTGASGYAMCFYHISKHRDAFWKTVIANWSISFALGIAFVLIAVLFHLARILIL